jgi:tetratricopeptide (TPR) repeat protein/DNA-binding CsgD family transcriptional regulator/biotin operon repressor
MSPPLSLVKHISLCATKQVFLFFVFITIQTNLFAITNLTQDTISHQSAITLFDYLNNATQEKIPHDIALEIIRNGIFQSELEKQLFIEYINNSNFSQTTPESHADYLFTIANWHESNGVYTESISAYHQSKIILQKHKLTSTHLYAKLCDRIGHLYYRFQDYERALDYLKEWNNHLIKNKTGDYNTLNTIGLIYFKLDSLDNAIIFYTKAINAATNASNSLWLGVISGNLAQVYKKKGDLKTYLQLCQKDYKLSIESNNYISAANVLLNLTDYYFSIPNLDTIQKLIDEAALLYIKEGKNPDQLHHYLAVRSKFYFAQKEYHAALTDLLKMNVIKDSIETQKNKIQSQNIEFRIYAQNSENEILILEKQKKHRNYTIVIISICSSLFAFLLLVIIKQERIKRRKDNELFLLKKQRIDKELKLAEENIRNLLQKIQERTIYIDNLTSDIEKLTQNERTNEQQTILTKLHENKILTEDDWSKFKRLFEELHPSFITTLLSSYPSLTNAEIRLATLIRLNLTPNEMANTLGISKESVQKTNLRLRNKMGIKTQEKLLSTILNIPHSQ